MNYSGIVVTALPAQALSLARQLAALPLTEVASIDEETGRMVVVLERASVGEEMDSLQAIQRLPGVVSADLVAHYFGDESAVEPREPADVARRLEVAGTPADRSPEPNSIQSRGETT